MTNWPLNPPPGLGTNTMAPGQKPSDNKPERPNNSVGTIIQAPMYVKERYMRKDNTFVIGTYNPGSGGIPSVVREFDFLCLQEMGGNDGERRADKLREMGFGLVMPNGPLGSTPLAYNRETVQLINPIAVVTLPHPTRTDPRAAGPTILKEKGLVGGELRMRELNDNLVAVSLHGPASQHFPLANRAAERQYANSVKALERYNGTQTPVLVGGDWNQILGRGATRQFTERGYRFDNMGLGNRGTHGSRNIDGFAYRGTALRFVSGSTIATNSDHRLWRAVYQLNTINRPGSDENA